ncbi:MAG: LamG-like jellyroll fold domain-containing protein, partial [Planctomycetota bacterium]
PADDVAHFKGDTLRAFGRRIAEVADAVRERPGAAPHAAYRLRFDRGTAEFRDAFGSPARVLAGRYETDPERGRVLRFNGTGGFDTTLTLGPAAYTKALWVKRARVVQPDEVLIAGNVRDEALARFGGHYFSRRFAGHVPADVAAPIPLRFNSNPVFAPTGRWDHMALTYDGTTGRFASYWNGELIGQGGAGYPVTDEALVVQLGCHGDRRGVRLDDGPPPTYGASPDAWIDDVFVAPIALGDEDVRALFESGRA